MDNIDIDQEAASCPAGKELEFRLLDFVDRFIIYIHNLTQISETADTSFIPSSFPLMWAYCITSPLATINAIAEKLDISFQAASKRAKPFRGLSILEELTGQKTKLNPASKRKMACGHKFHMIL